MITFLGSTGFRRPCTLYQGQQGRVGQTWRKKPADAHGTDLHEEGNDKDTYKCEHSEVSLIIYHVASVLLATKSVHENVR